MVEQKEVLEKPHPPAMMEDPKKPPSVAPSASFKEESNLISDLDPLERKALDELKQLLQTAIAAGEFTPPSPATAPSKEPPITASSEEPESLSSVEAVVETVEGSPSKEESDGAKTVEAIAETVVPVPEKSPVASTEGKDESPLLEEVRIWGIPLLGDQGSDTVLLKFLRARDFKTREAMTMIKSVVEWRREFRIEALVDEDLGVPEMEKAVFMHGTDLEGHPVCYNVYKDLYAIAFSDEEKKERFLRWRIQFLENGIRKFLDFSSGGVSTMVQVTDLRNSPGPLKRDLRQALVLLQDNYPEFAAKQIFINVPWWYLAYNKMASHIFTQRSKSKFVFAGPSRSADTLFKYIAPEKVPVQFGGLSNKNNPDFTTSDIATVVTITLLAKQVVEIPITEASQLVFEIRVLGLDVTYSSEFVPSSKGRYTLIVQKARKLSATDEPVVKASFKTSEAGMMVLTVDNTTSKKKKQLLYRYKVKIC